MSDIPSPLERLIRRLDLEPQERDVFLGHTGQGEGALFGGLVAAQAVVAAGRTVAIAGLHSLHGYFLRPGRHGLPIRFRVDRERDGRTFSTRHVVARQADETIFSLTASFAKAEQGISHQDPFPTDTPEPDGLPEWEDVRAGLLGTARRPDGPIAVRVCDPETPARGEKLPARRRVWMRPRGRLPEDALLQAATLVFASDRTLIRTAARPHGLTWHLRMAASLDHTVWLHRAVRFDDWVLYVCESPVAHAARALVLGAMYSRDGTRIASVAQEGVLRV